MREADSIAYGGRPITWGKKQADALHGTAVTGAQASREGFPEITSGSCRPQQGLVATCSDSSNELKPKKRRASGIGAGGRTSDALGSNALAGGGPCLPDGGNAHRFHFQRGGRTPSRHKPTRPKLSCEQTIRSRGVSKQRLNFAASGRPRMRCQDFKPDLGNSAVRHYGGPPKT
jgi:hypothetical protein